MHPVASRVGGEDEGAQLPLLCEGEDEQRGRGGELGEGRRHVGDGGEGSEGGGKGRGVGVEVWLGGAEGEHALRSVWLEMGAKADGLGGGVAESLAFLVLVVGVDGGACDGGVAVGADLDGVWGDDKENGGLSARDGAELCAQLEGIGGGSEERGPLVARLSGGVGQCWKKGDGARIGLMGSQGRRGGHEKVGV